MLLKNELSSGIFAACCLFLTWSATLQSGWIQPGALHHAVMTNIEPGKQYYYKYGDQVSGCILIYISTLMVSFLSTLFVYVVAKNNYRIHIFTPHSSPASLWGNVGYAIKDRNQPDPEPLYTMLIEPDTVPNLAQQHFCYSGAQILVWKCAKRG